MNKDHLIDRYFENSLTPKEQKIFNDLLQSDTAFNEEFKFQKDLKKVIAINQQEELKQVLKNKEEGIQKDSIFSLLPKKWLVAASIVLILGLSIWSLKSTFYPSNEAIYSDYFQPARNIVQPVVRGEEINTIEYKAFVAYESKDYYKAINLFNSVENSDQSSILFYKALCFMALDKSDEAIRILGPLATADHLVEEDGEVLEMSKWYLGLAYVQNDDKDNAMDQFSEIIENPTVKFKKQEAIEVLNYLK